MPPLATPTENRILSTLAAREPAHEILARVVPVRLNPGQVLATGSECLEHGFFVTKGIVCGHTVMKNGGTTGNLFVGPEGFVGLSLLFGSTKMPLTMIAKLSGTAMRIDARSFLQAFDKPGLFRDIMRRYALSRVTSMMQTAACNTLHCIRERMACCLLQIADRVGTDFELTHEAIAQMLGNRRATVTTESDALRRLGLISSGYGQLRIVNRRGLEEVACECYEVHKEAVENVFQLPNRFD